MKSFVILTILGICSFHVMAAPFLLPLAVGAQGLTAFGFFDARDIVGAKGLAKSPGIIFRVIDPAMSTYKNLKGSFADSRVMWSFHYVKAALEGLLPNIEKLAIPSLKELRRQSPPVASTGKKMREVA